MSERSQTFLWDRQAKGRVEATLIDSLDSAEIESAIASWKPLVEMKAREWLAEGRPRREWPQHHHWDWRTKARRYYGLLAYQFMGVECDGAMQGMMLAATEGKPCRIPEEAGKPLVYVSYIATAPWNDPEYTDAPHYGAVGKVLMAAAVQLSLESGFRGRVGLHALPQAQEFYRDCGMTELGVDASVEDLVYFEMTPRQAKSFITASEANR